MLLYKSGILCTKKQRQNLVESCRINNFNFAENTTCGLGGKAVEAYMPRTIAEAEAVYDSLIKRGRRFVIVGNGSNILAADGQFDGAVICTKKLKGIAKFNNNLLFCLAGTTVSDLLKYCLKHSVGGLEYLVGIPATIGGLAFMNGGAGGFFIGDNITCVKFYNGKVNNLSHEKCNFTYKHSTMRDINGLILGVFVKIAPFNTMVVSERINEFKYKRAHQPKGKSCGCVFKNVNGVSAGAIIEGCGLKGARVGRAFVSPIHANFIINKGNSSSDVKELIDFVKRTVFEKRRIMLEEEVVYIDDHKN